MVKNITVPSSHFLFWTCKCGHVYGRHHGTFSDWPNATYCFDCTCKKFDGAEPFEQWQQKERDKNRLPNKDTRSEK
jgi:hypothetical protein